MFLKQSTAVDVLIGPFVATADGYTTDSGSVPATEVLLSKNGQGLAGKSDVTDPAHDSAGFYNCELDATDTNTVGTLNVVIEGDTGTLPVYQEFQVVEEAVYDKYYASGATGTDTGVEETLDRTYAKVDTGISAEITAIDSTTLVSNLSNKTDTGVPLSVWASTTRTLSAFAFDTGIWASNVDRSLTSFGFDTGVAQTVWRESGSTYTDTGSLGYMVDNPPGATIDTGVVNQAVWQADADRQLTGFAFDTGIQQALSRVDTGLSETIDRTYSKADTGYAAELLGLSSKLDTGVSAEIADLKGKVDTGVDHDVVEALTVDTYAEPGQERPGATASLATKIGYTYKAWRNRHTQTGSTYSLYNDDEVTVGQVGAVSDNGTTFERGELDTGA